MKSIIQLPQHLAAHIESGGTVLAYVAAIKYINATRRLDALKGFLVDRKNPQTPLENPCVIELKKGNADYKSPKYYR